MKKLISIGGAAALAIALSLSAASPSAADPAGAAIAGGVLGFMAGAAVGSAAANSPPPRPYHEGGDYAWRRHVRACFDAYGRDYDPRTDTYLSRGGHPRYCRL
ncbi:MAG TPA: hypothetical protein VL418_09130 [Devosiaceae bacterium]|jgi:hypothetical protein|nr:hypothetical protein [Devosiaceae bacterium]